MAGTYEITEAHKPVEDRMDAATWILGEGALKGAGKVMGKAGEAVTCYRQGGSGTMLRREDILPSAPPGKPNMPKRKNPGLEFYYDETLKDTQGIGNYLSEANKRGYILCGNDP